MLEPLGYPLTDRGWPAVPDALREWLTRSGSRFCRRSAHIHDHQVRLLLLRRPGRVRSRSTDQPFFDYLDAHLRWAPTAITSAYHWNDFFGVRRSVS